VKLLDRSRVPARTQGRDTSLDVAKGALIFLVVLGHALPGGHPVTEAIYLFHMPAFVFISGVLTREAPLTGPRLDGLLTRLLAPLLVFQVLYVAFELLAPGRGALTMETVLTPRWPLWFLAALLVWRLMSPVLSRLRGALVASVVLYLATGGVELPQIFSINYIVSFLPFFLLGLRLEPAALHRLRVPKVRAVSAGVLLSAGWAIWALQDVAALRPWFELAHSYESLQVSAVEGVALKLLHLVAAGLVMAAFISILPANVPLLVTAGLFSMYPYLLHRFALKAYEWWGGAWEPRVEFLLLVTGSIAFTLGTLSPAVRRVFRPLVEPKADWLLKVSRSSSTRHPQGTRSS
jgi:fucose 4-O-acetylase-like acetyltransferase